MTASITRINILPCLSTPCVDSVGALPLTPPPPTIPFPPSDNGKWPCSSYNSCGGNRGGVLCGECLPGFVESLGSATCAALSQCGNDGSIVWPMIVITLLVAAIMQLAVVSDVWAPSNTYPSGKMKMVIYFSQVCALGGWARRSIFHWTQLLCVCGGGGGV